LHGLPSTIDLELLAAVVRESADHFFTGATDVVPGVVHRSGEDVTGAGFDRRLLEAMSGAAHEHGLSVACVVPTAATLPLAFRPGPLKWRDGDVEMSFMRDGQLFGDVRWDVSAEDEEGASGEALPALHAAGADHRRFADAFAATRVMAPVSSRFLSAPLASKGTQTVSRGRATVAVIACAVALLIVVLAPLFSAMRAERTSLHEIAQVRGRLAAVMEIDQELARVTQSLKAISDLRARRRSALIFLGQLVHGLPAGSAAVTLRLDSLGGTLTVLGPRADDIVARLDSVPGIGTPEIVGPVTRENVGGQVLDRIMVRFRHAMVVEPALRAPSGGMR
jgi:hypothetical protein